MSHKKRGLDCSLQSLAVKFRRFGGSESAPNSRDPPFYPQQMTFVRLQRQVRKVLRPKSRRWQDSARDNGWLATFARRSRLDNASRLTKTVSQAWLGIRHMLIFHRFGTAARGHHRCLHASGCSAISNARVALPNFYNIAIGIANIAARLTVLGLRLRDELCSSTSPKFITRLNICNADIHKAAD